MYTTDLFMVQNVMPCKVQSGINVKIKTSFYYAVLLFYVVVYVFTDAAFTLFVAHFLFKDVNIS